MACDKPAGQLCVDIQMDLTGDFYSQIQRLVHLMLTVEITACCVHSIKHVSAVRDGALSKLPMYCLICALAACRSPFITFPQKQHKQVCVPYFKDLEPFVDVRESSIHVGFYL